MNAKLDQLRHITSNKLIKKTDISLNQVKTEENIIPPTTKYNK